MAEEPQQLFEHKWLFVIIPVEKDKEYRSGYSQINATEALLAAYCKHCDSYYTKTLFWAPSGSFEGHAGLPRWGCIGPEGRF